MPRRRRHVSRGHGPVTREEFDALRDELSQLQGRSLLGRTIVPMLGGGAAGDDGYEVYYDGRAATADRADTAAFADQGIPATDGGTPTPPPFPFVRPGPGFLQLSWLLPSGTVDPLFYHVFVDTTPDFVADFGVNWVGTTYALSLVVNLDGAGNQLQTGTTYYLKAYAVSSYSGNASDFSEEVSGSPGVLDAEVTTIANIDAGTITVGELDAARIGAGTIQAAHLESVLVLSSVLKTAEAGQRVEIDQEGVRLVSEFGNTLVDLPTDSANDPTFRGNVITGGLTVTGNALIQGDDNSLDDGAVLTLSAQLSDPSTAPVVAVDIEEQALTGYQAYSSQGADGFAYDPNGDVGGLTPTFLTGRKFYLEEFDASTGERLRMRDLRDFAFDVLGDALAWVNGPNIRGVARLGSYIYVLTIDRTEFFYTESNPYSWDVMLWKLNQSDLSFVSAQWITGDVAGWTSTNSAYNGTATLGTDGTDLLVATLNSTGTSAVGRVVRYDGDLTELSTQVLSGVSYGRPNGQSDPRIVGIEKPNASGGYWLMIREDPTYGNVVHRYDATSGAYTGNYDFASGFEHKGLAAVPDSSSPIFFGLRDTGGVPSVVRFTEWIFSTEEDTYWFGYTWTDGSGHETQVSPLATLTVPRRKRVKVTLPSFPAGVTGFKVYAERSATEPGTVLLQSASGGYVTSESSSPTYMENFDTGGAADPASNNFPGGTSTIRSAGDEWLLGGDGTVSIPSLMPVGAVVPYAGATAPGGFLIADGTAVSRSQYEDLFDVIGTTYGAGDGVSTFNLPNLTGRVPVGKHASWAEFDALGESGGERTHTLTTSEVPDTTLKDGSGTQIREWDAATGGGGTAALRRGGTSPAIKVDGGNGAHNNLQPYLTLNYIIKH